MDHQGLINLIDRVVSALQTDYSIVKFYTESIQYNLGDKHLNWNLSHMNTSMLDFIRDLERHQEYLKKDINASKKIQE